jgi:hypothetical protein
MFAPNPARVPASTYGYDICDHNRLNPELGSEDDFERFLEALTRHQCVKASPLRSDTVVAIEGSNVSWLRVSCL